MKELLKQSLVVYLILRRKADNTCRPRDGLSYIGCVRLQLMFIHSCFQIVFSRLLSDSSISSFLLKVAFLNSAALGLNLQVCPVCQIILANWVIPVYVCM